MSETIKNDVPSGETGSEILSEMKDNFDPTKAEAAKQEALGNETSEFTTDHRGRKYVDLDKIDISAEDGQWQFVKGYVENARNRAMTSLEDEYGDKVDYKKIEIDGTRDVEKGKDTLAAEYTIAEEQHKCLEQVGDYLVTEAALGRENSSENVVDILRKRAETAGRAVNLNYRPKTDVEPVERLLKALENRLNSQSE